MTTQSSPRVERANLFVESWNGILTRLKDIYSAKSNIIGAKDISVIPTANPDALERMLQQQSKELTLPAIGVSLTTVEPNLNSFNTSEMRRMGYAMMVDDSRDSWIIAKIAPVVMTFQATIQTDDCLTMLKMIDRWMSTETWGFTLEIESSTIMFKIKVVPDKNISVPPPAPGAGGSDQYKLTTNLKVETYSGYIWRVPSIREFEMDFGVTKTTIADVIQNPANGIIAVETKITNPKFEPLF
jgi:hypothetical protein